jgi:biotin carboxyl carrier protein
MKRFVNGDEAELVRTGAELNRTGDRWLIRTPEGTFSAVVIRHEAAVYVSFKGKQYRVEERQSRTRVAAQAGSGELRAPMPGQIVDVRHFVGDAVRKGDTILVLEAMKTQQPFAAPFDGKVVQINVVKGDQVNDGAVLAIVEPNKPKDG